MQEIRVWWWEKVRKRELRGKERKTGKKEKNTQKIRIRLGERESKKMKTKWRGKNTKKSQEAKEE